MSTKALPRSGPRGSALSDSQLDAAFAALADPTRRAIVIRLARGDATVTDLAKPFDMTLPAISKHLKVLEKSGLITHSRQAQYRPRHLERHVLDEAVAWIEDARRVWQERFDNLDAHLREVQATPPSRNTTPRRKGAS